MHNHNRSTSDGRAAQPRPDLEAHLSKLIYLQDQDAKLSRMRTVLLIYHQFLPHIACDYYCTPRRLYLDR